MVYMSHILHTMSNWNNSFIVQWFCMLITVKYFVNNTGKYYFYGSEKGKKLFSCLRCMSSGLITNIHSTDSKWNIFVKFAMNIVTLQTSKLGICNCL